MTTFKAARLEAMTACIEAEEAREGVSTQLAVDSTEDVQTIEICVIYGVDQVGFVEWTEAGWAAQADATEPLGVFRSATEALAAIEIETE